MSVRARLIGRKLPYYGRSLASLARIATLRSIARCVATSDKRLVLRDRGSLRLATALDLLVLKETWLDDAYGLRSVHVDDEAVIVDVGAGVGDFALAAARLFPDVQVYAFEPNPSTFELLELNVTSAGAANVRPVRSAIGIATSYTLGRVSAGPRASARARGAPNDAVEVPGVRLDDALGDAQVALLKIDTEGLELDVLRSAGSALARVKAVALEYHRELLPRSDELVSEYLRARGFVTSARPDPYDDGIGYVYARRLSRSRAEPAQRTERP